MLTARKWLGITLNWLGAVTVYFPLFLNALSIKLNIASNDKKNIIAFIPTDIFSPPIY